MCKSCSSCKSGHNPICTLDDAVDFDGGAFHFHVSRHLAGVQRGWRPPDLLDACDFDGGAFHFDIDLPACRAVGGRTTETPDLRGADGFDGGAFNFDIYLPACSVE